MNPTIILDLIKKHGAMGVLVVWLFYTNQRLTDVERELYRCYDKFQPTANRLKTRTLEGNKYFAVLPKETKIKKKQA